MAEAGGDMADMAAAGDAAAEMTATMEAMTPAMTMSFLLPGIGLGLLKGLLIGIIYLVTLIFRKGPKRVIFITVVFPTILAPLYKVLELISLVPGLSTLEPQYFFI